METKTYEQVAAELEVAEARLHDAIEAYKASNYEDKALGRAYGMAERDRDMIAQALRSMPRPKPAAVDYGRCPSCGKKLSEFDAKCSDRAGYCYDCA